MFGFYRLASAIPRIKVADVSYNVDKIIKLWNQAEEKKCAVVAFPEMAICGYTCGDLFLQARLLSAVIEGISKLVEESKRKKSVIVVGAPVHFNARLYDCAVIIQAGKILGIVTKSFLPNYMEYYEKRWFGSGRNIKGETINLLGQQVPFGVDLIFEHDRLLSFGVEICEDLWNVIPPSCYQAIAGATVIVNTSASNDLVGKSEYRRQLVIGQSARCLSAYLYSSAGVGESSTDLVFGGHAMIAENGNIIAESERFERDDVLIYSDVDCERLSMFRLRETTHADNLIPVFRRIKISEIPEQKKIDRKISHHPFVPNDIRQRDKHCLEIFRLQSSALATRLEHSGLNSVVIGVSGGLDSTLALLVASETFKILGIPTKNIFTVIMPGYGTSKRTHDNAIALCEKLETNIFVIDITASCEQHFKDINYDQKNVGITFENAQARERTQILMDVANKEKGLVIGTGDLSEIALGWTTFNGDHMSMYNVNCSVPKTLVKYLVKWIADGSSDESLRLILSSIIDTPISPELLPKSSVSEYQKTEDSIGPFELQDFFLFYFIRYGASPEKIRFLAQAAFGDKYSKEEIKKWLDVFIKRFFSQQFKRNCIPDGPKIGLIALSPRGDWRMPSDASSDEWLK